VVTEISRSGIILSGGSSSRLGQDKGLAELEGKPLICWVIERLQPIVDEVIVVIGSEDVKQRYLRVIPKGIEVVADIYQEKSPLIGLITGLRISQGEYAVVCACDMPFIKPEIIEMMFKTSYGFNGTLLVKPEGWIEAMPSIYHVTNCLSYAEVLRGLGEMRIRKVLETMPNTVVLEIEKMNKFDPNLLSFMDLDTVASIDEAKKFLHRQKSNNKILDRSSSR
jgi:molybdopterin-guanine dinucleotide biosynthesis protein A